MVSLELSSILILRKGDMMNDILLETKNLTKVFKGGFGVKGVSLAIPEGKIYGLLGPNGAGKSTIMKLLLGLLPKDEGEILYRGRPWTREVLKETGALIEGPAIYKNLTAMENLNVHATLLGLPKERMEEVLSLTGLENTGKKRAGHFSVGMKQRLGLAVALLRKPRFLLLDEPGNGLDPLGTEALRNLLSSLAEGGCTILLSSHILGEVSLMAETLGILNEGKLIYQGTSDIEGSLEEFFLKEIKEGLS